MKHALILSATALGLVGCGSGAETEVDNGSEAVADAPMASGGAVPLSNNRANDAVQTQDQTQDQTQRAADVQNGAVVLSVERLVSEPSACLVMMRVTNGLDEPANVGLFAFDITGNGETMGANMFPQTAEPGQSQTAQIVLPGADCDNVIRIESGQLNCTLPDSEGESCVDAVVLRDGTVDFAVDE